MQLRYFLVTETGLLLILASVFILSGIYALVIQLGRSTKSSSLDRMTFYCFSSALIMFLLIVFPSGMDVTVQQHWYWWLTELRGERRAVKPLVVLVEISESRGTLDKYHLLKALEFIDKSNPRVIGLAFNPLRYGVESDLDLRGSVRNAKLAYFEPRFREGESHDSLWDKDSEAADYLDFSSDNYPTSSNDLYYRPFEQKIFYHVAPLATKLVQLSTVASESLLARVPTNDKGLAVINPYKDKTLWSGTLPKITYQPFTKESAQWGDFWLSGVETRGKPASDTARHWTDGIVTCRLDLRQQMLVILKWSRDPNRFTPVDTVKTLLGLKDKIIIVSGYDPNHHWPLYGMEVQNIIDQDFLREPDSRLYPFLGLFTLALFYFFHSRVHPWKAFAGTVVLVVAGIGILIFLFLKANLLINPYPIVASFIGATFFMFTYELASERIRLMEERTRLTSQLKAAHDMQMGLLPKNDPVVTGMEISGICRPADEVGGDYFDHVWLNDERTKLGIAVADVSGKAMKAAITAVMTSGMVYREVGTNETPKAILRKINRPMYLKTDKRIFTAMSFAVIDTVSKSLAFSNAGQMQPLLKRNGKIESLKVEGARLPLGMAEDVEYDELTIPLQSDDVIVFYTDGIPEAMNAKNEMFGFERLEAIVKESSANLSAKQLAATIVDKVAEFTGSSKQHDDTTVVVVRVL
jgi:serine phosphatase RsbU (regulator of sigma subunit)